MFSLLRLATLLLCLLAGRVSAASGVALTPEEQSWINTHKQQVFTVGFAPYVGMDYFEFRGRPSGLLPAVLGDIRTQLGLNLQLADTRNWADAYQRFTRGQIDLLYGANPTPEREQIMRFTTPVQRYPYVVIARRGSQIQTLGDLDNHAVGFLTQDFAIQRLPQEYPNIHFLASTFLSLEEGLGALQAGKIDSFVTAGGGVEHEIIFNHPNLNIVANLPSISSDMTFAVLKEQAMLASVLNKYVQQHRAALQILARDSKQRFYRKILQLTEAELAWLEQKGQATVGVADDYLPFDFYQDGEYKGIAGETLKTIGTITGIRFKVVHGSFAALYERARQGDIDILNLAKTEERQHFFLYPRPFSTERDIIVGRKSSPPVHDVYGLENKRVAVIAGFWHEEYLRKNLKQVSIVPTADIMESLQLVQRGKADYLIENPTVAEFYINGLGYGDLVKRGSTSKDSFVYFGVTRQQPELARIMDKALSLIDFEEIKYAGIQSVPTLQNRETAHLVMVVLALLAVLILILLITARYILALADQKAQTQILKEREHLLYTDTLTGFHNRNYLSHFVANRPPADLPQAVLIADLNNLKPVNDAHGHATGDALLVLFAELLREVFPAGHIFRIGGDEFLILQEQGTEQTLNEAIARVEQRCREVRHAVTEQVHVHPSAAIGFCLHQAEQETLDELIRCADAKMYLVKASMKQQDERRT